MTQIHQIALAAAFGLAAVGAQAHTIETDYPLVGGPALVAERVIDSRDLQPAEPLLAQSHAEGPKFVGDARSAIVAGEASGSEPTVRFLQAPDVEYPAS